jgi:hypothetical protein
MIFCALLVMDIHALAMGTDVARFLCRKAFDKQGVSILLGERDEQDSTCFGNLSWPWFEHVGHGPKQFVQH